MAEMAANVVDLYFIAPRSDTGTGVFRILVTNYQKLNGFPSKLNVDRFEQF